MNKSVILSIFAASILAVACGNKMKPMEPTFNADQQNVEQSEEDTTSTPIKEEVQPSEAKPSAPSSSYTPSTTRSRTSSHSDNMRGFDPASDDDMDDNGMSRYMENNDDEGWD